MRMNQAARPRGIELWRGPSELTGERVVFLATLASENAKTGNMIQTWIMDAAENPLDALATGADRNVCGNCPHRPQGMADKGTCYVNVDKAPFGVWHAWRRGAYPRLDPIAHQPLFAGRTIRLGAYGDPAAVPVQILAALIRWSGGSGRAGCNWTGYTHSWRTAPAELADYVMASADTPGDAAEAHARGWRTFRVRSRDEDLARNEIACPASDEGGKRVTCERCRLCSGNRIGTARHGANVAIYAHGSFAIETRFRRVQQRITALTIGGMAQ